MDWNGMEVVILDGNCQLLFADDTALFADTEEKLHQLVTEFGTVCDLVW